MALLNFTALRCALASATLLAAGCVAHLPGQSPDTANDPTAATAAQQAERRDQQVPGVMRMRLGNTTVTALYDGAVNVDSHLLQNASASAIAQLLREGKQPASGALTAINAFLVDDGLSVVLVDAGAADNAGPTAGQLRQALRAAGYRPEDIQAVVLTHLHPDHVGGLLHEGVMAFPNATVYAPQKDASYWLSEQVRLMAPESQRSSFWAAQAAVWPYQNSGRFRTFHDGPLHLAGLHAVPMPGHTPGHTGFLLHGGSESLLIWGDLVHSHTTQLPNPRIAVAFDADPVQAHTTRSKVLHEVAQSGQWVAGSHMPFPGIGRVIATGKTSYRWLPIEHSQAMATAAQRQP